MEVGILQCDGEAFTACFVLHVTWHFAYSRFIHLNPQFHQVMRINVIARTVVIINRLRGFMLKFSKILVSGYV